MTPCTNRRRTIFSLVDLATRRFLYQVIREAISASFTSFCEQPHSVRAAARPPLAGALATTGSGATNCAAGSIGKLASTSGPSAITSVHAANERTASALDVPDWAGGSWITLKMLAIAGGRTGFSGRSLFFPVVRDGAVVEYRSVFASHIP